MPRRIRKPTWKQRLKQAARANQLSSGATRAEELLSLNEKVMLSIETELQRGDAQGALSLAKRLEDRETGAGRHREFLTAFTVTMMIWLFPSSGEIPRVVYGLPTFWKTRWPKQRLTVVLFHCVMQEERNWCSGFTDP